MKRVIIFLLLIIIISSSLPIAFAEPEAVLVMEEIIKMPPLPTIDHGIVMDPFTILEEEIPMDNPLIYIPELKLQAFIREILGMKKYYPIENKHLLMLGGTLDLTGLGLTNLGGLEYATNLTGIIADGSKLPYIPADLNIKYLSINNCGLTQLPEAINSM